MHIILAPVACICSIIAIASAAPSTWTDPEPSSSIRTSDRGVISERIDEMFAMCAEKVESACSIDCSSPISANILSKNPIFASSRHGTKSPDFAIRQSNPVVFSETVFPPVFGPVTISAEYFSPSAMSIGTHLSFGIRG